MNKQKLIDWYIHRDIRLGRGLNWIGKPKMIVSIIAYAMIILMYLKIELSPIWLITSGIILTIAFITIGEIDYRKGIWKRQALLSTVDYNPYYKSLTKQITFLDTKINEVISQIKQLQTQLKEQELRSN